jgi:replicative DNA helicase
MTKLYSYQTEKHVLGGLINNPRVFADIDVIISEKDFYSDVHSTIFSCIKSTVFEGGEIANVTVAQKIKNLGISFKDDINIFDYVESISFTQISPRATIQAACDLKDKKIRRDVEKNAGKIINHLGKTLDKPISSVIAECDELYAENVNEFYSLDVKPRALLEGIIEEIELRGNEPTEEVGLQIPYENFNRLFGGLRPKCLYTVVARAGNGKTTFISDLARKTGELNGTKTLVLDTEMPTQDVEMRMFASISKVPMWYLETGQWSKNKELYRKTNEGFEKVKKYLEKKLVHHYHVGEKNIDEICSIARKWKLSEVGRDKPCIIAFDFLEIGSDKTSNNWAEWQIMGEKVKKLKRLAVELKVPVVIAMQSNRGGEGRKLGDDIDSRVIASSDRVQWFSDFTFFLAQKTREEIQWDGEERGTHMLVNLKARYQGRHAMGHQDLVRRRDPNGNEKFYNNFINLEIQNFNVEERGTLHDIAEEERMQLRSEDRNTNDGELL